MEVKNISTMQKYNIVFWWYCVPIARTVSRIETNMAQFLHYYI